MKIPSVRIGDKLATKVSATLGESGFNVYGEEICAEPGNDFCLRKGKNTRLVEEEPALYSLNEQEHFDAKHPFKGKFIDFSGLGRGEL